MFLEPTQRKNGQIGVDYILKSTLVPYNPSSVLLQKLNATLNRLMLCVCVSLFETVLVLAPLGNTQSCCQTYYNLVSGDYAWIHTYDESRASNPLQSLASRDITTFDGQEDEVVRTATMGAPAGGAGVVGRKEKTFAVSLQ